MASLPMRRVTGARGLRMMAYEMRDDARTNPDVAADLLGALADLLLVKADEVDAACTEQLGRARRRLTAGGTTRG